MKVEMNNKLIHEKANGMLICVYVFTMQIQFVYPSFIRIRPKLARYTFNICPWFKKERQEK